MPDRDRKGTRYSKGSSRTFSCWSPSLLYALDLLDLLYWCFTKAVVAAFQYVNLCWGWLHRAWYLPKTLLRGPPSYTGGRTLSHSRRCSAATDTFHTNLLWMNYLNSSCQMRLGNLGNFPRWNFSGSSERNVDVERAEDAIYFLLTSWNCAQNYIIVCIILFTL